MVVRQLKKVKTINKLWSSKIGSILDYSAEGKKMKATLKNVYEQGIQILEESRNNKRFHL